MHRVLLKLKYLAKALQGSSLERLFKCKFLEVGLHENGTYIDVFALNYKFRIPFGNWNIFQRHYKDANLNASSSACIQKQFAWRSYLNFACFDSEIQNFSWKPKFYSTRGTVKNTSSFWSRYRVVTLDSWITNLRTQHIVLLWGVLRNRILWERNLNFRE